MKEQFMKLALELAYENALLQRGGPFGAVIVKDGKIVGTGVNCVTAANDPTAHAEVQAIRAACTALGSFQLTDCEIYTSCEPCPMCLGAIYWARPKTIYYYYTRGDAAAIGFDDAHIYQQISLPPGARHIPAKQFIVAQQPDAFAMWQRSAGKISY